MKLGKISVSLFLLATLLTVNLQYSCDFSPTPEEEIDSLFLFTENSKFYYDFKRIEEKYELPYILAEVSGLAFLGGDKLMMLEDETAAAYEYNLSTKKIDYRLVFGSPGDFEGIEMANEKVYAMKSNGDIFAFSFVKDKEVNVVKYETRLSASNDAEGFGFDLVTGNLLIATKDDGDLKDHDVKGCAVYEFDAASGKIILPEVFSIDNEKLEKYFEKNKGGNYDEEKFVFQPSGIAVNPIDKNYYIIASKGHMLLVIDRQGEIIASYPFSHSTLPQPEGICFAPNGDMYISSEGDGERGFVIKLKMLKR